VQHESEKCPMSKAPASISQDAMTNGLECRHYLLIPHDDVKEATDIGGYSVGFIIKPATTEISP